MSPPKIAIIIYSMYGHIVKLARAEQEGIIKAGGTADLYQVPETLSPEILAKMSAPAKQDIAIASPKTLTEYDAFLFGIPTRFGNMPAQWKTLWDSTGKLWKDGSLSGKYAGVFVSTSGPGGGQETTGYTFMTTLTHQGMVFVPLGYNTGFANLISLDEVCGGSPWGAGTYTASNGSRFPTPRELDIARAQGKAFYEIVSRVNWD